MNENGSNSNVNRKITSIISRTQMIDTEIKSRNDFIKIPASTASFTPPREFNRRKRLARLAGAAFKARSRNSGKN